MTMKPVRNMNGPTEMLDPPEWFNEDQKKIYHTLGARVLKLKVWEQTDHEAYCILVDNLYQYQQASKLLTKDGIMIKGRDGWVRHPAVMVRNACWQNIQPLLVAFGLTPAARAHFGIIEDEAEDPVAEFLNSSKESNPKHH